MFKQNQNGWNVFIKTVNLTFILSILSILYPEICAFTQSPTTPDILTAKRSEKFFVIHSLGLLKLLPNPIN